MQVTSATFTIQRRLLVNVAAALSAVNALCFLSDWFVGWGFMGGSPNLFEFFQAHSAVSLVVALAASVTLVSRGALWPCILLALDVVQLLFHALWLVIEAGITKLVGLLPWAAYIRVSATVYLLAVFMLAAAILTGGRKGCETNGSA